MHKIVHVEKKKKKVKTSHGHIAASRKVKKSSFIPVLPARFFFCFSLQFPHTSSYVTQKNWWWKMSLLLPSDRLRWVPHTKRMLWKNIFSFYTDVNF